LYVVAALVFALCADGKDATASVEGMVGSVERSEKAAVWAGDMEAAVVNVGAVGEHGRHVFEMVDSSHYWVWMR
jgi:hypothetical protein